MRLRWMIAFAGAAVLGKFFAQSDDAEQKNSQTGGQNDLCRFDRSVGTIWQALAIRGWLRS